MIENLIKKIFDLRTAAHLAHWKTKSYSEHVALGEFYDELLSSLDKYVEAQQGVFGLIGKVEGETKNIKTAIHDELLWITENRSKISKDVPALENIIDELSAVHMKALYKLENLR